jgi:putative membrane protein
MHLVRRIAVIWAIDSLALLMLAPIVPGLELTSWIWAIWAIAVIGLLNALVRPFLLVVTLPFTVLTLGLFSLLLNAFIVLLADYALPGLYVADILAALWTGLGIAVINTFVTGVLSINDDESFYRNVILGFARRTVPAERTRNPGLVMLEIDGLSERALQQALDAGYMPVLQRWLDEGRFRLTPWQCGLPSQTSSSQAGILYGRNDDIPAFRWYEKDSHRMMISNRPWTASEIHERVSDGTGLLANDGSSLTNLVSGDAPNSAMTMSSLLHPSGRLRASSNGYYLLFLNPYSFSRTLVLMVWELLRELGQHWRTKLRRNGEPHTRGGTFPILRAITNVFLRDLNLYLLIEDVLSGTPVVYSTFLGYDVVAHHVGPLNSDALQTLKHFDEGLDALERALKRAPRPYQFVLLSDHGQSAGATFQQRYGLTLEQLVERALDGREQVSGNPTEDESWAHLNALLSQAIHVENVAGRTARRVFRRRTRDGYVEVSPPREPMEEPETGVVVCTSGNLGLIYFTVAESRLSLEALTVRYPRLISALISHPGIGFVMVHSELYGPVVIGRQGINYLDSGYIDGIDPLRTFGGDAAAQLKRLDSFSNVGDVVVNSTYYSNTGEVAAFEELVGSHGGLGGDQTSAFVIYPSSWEPPTEEIDSPIALHNVLRKWIRDHSERFPSDGNVTSPSDRKSTQPSSVPVGSSPQDF